MILYLILSTFQSHDSQHFNILLTVKALKALTMIIYYGSVKKKPELNIESGRSSMKYYKLLQHIANLHIAEQKGQI